MGERKREREGEKQSDKRERDGLGGEGGAGKYVRKMGRRKGKRGGGRDGEGQREMRLRAAGREGEDGKLNT